MVGIVSHRAQKHAPLPHLGRNGGATSTGVHLTRFLRLWFYFILQVWAVFLEGGGRPTPTGRVEKNIGMGLCGLGLPS